MRLNIDELRRQTVGRWPDILTALGISAEVLARRRNQPCPACGGTDRFQWIDKGSGRFVCRGIDNQGGDGFALVQHWLGCDFLAAARAVADVLGIDSSHPLPERPKPAQTPAKRPKDQRAAVTRLWQEAQPIEPGDPVARYLAGRGLVLEPFPDALRHHPALPYWAEVADRPVLLGHFPAMLAAVSSPSGALVALHRTYLNDAGGKADIRHPTSGEALKVKKLMVGREGDMRGAAIRLYPPEDGRLALAEGIETALAVRLGSRVPSWAAVSAWGMANAALPDAAGEIFIMADNDASQAGQKAAEALARRLVSESREVRILTPTTPGADWLDVLTTTRKPQ
ncbi:Toprim domain-containing protein [Chromobacterium vaccinii]|nr:Toprim domain-containing protein [Chromobacterium vaccinii]QND88645.1 Toprim domain-containing protein [Chromobacterium vaccinii]